MNTRKFVNQYKPIPTNTNQYKPHLATSGCVIMTEIENAIDNNASTDGIKPAL